MAIDSGVIQDFIESIKPQEFESANRSSAIVSHIDEEDVVWVNVAGSTMATPTASTSSEVNVGDAVTVEFRNNKLYIVGNYSNPSAGGERVDDVEQATAEAVTMAINATNSASIAKTAADSAQESAESALGSATNAAAYAEQALGEATQATEYANEAKESAGDALTAATGAQESASDANRAAQDAIKSADTALKNLGIVEDVVNVVEWISTHGYYAPCTESEVFDNKVYYTVVATAVSNPDGNPSSNGYYELVDDQYLITEDDTVVSGKTYYTLQATQVSEPTGDPSANSYYQLVLKEAVAQYVNTHLALTDDGLWVTNDNESEYRMLVSANSIQIRNKQNDAVATYGDAITLGVGNTVTTIDNEKMACDKIVFTELYPKGTGLVLIARSNGHFSIKPVE